MSPSVPTIVLTGATSGIGRCAAIALARQGANLVLTARSQARADATAAMIEAAAPGTRVHVHYGDFADLASVAALGREIAARHTRIDALINNAGLHAFKPRVTADGYSEMVAVNYLAPWLLTNILRQTMIRSAPSRIVTVASEASRRAAGFDPLAALVDKRPFSARGSSAIYGQTKLMNIMFSMELARGLTGTGVAVNCLCPGFNVTGLGRDLWFAATLERGRIDASTRRLQHHAPCPSGPRQPSDRCPRPSVRSRSGAGRQRRWRPCSPGGHGRRPRYSPAPSRDRSGPRTVQSGQSSATAVPPRPTGRDRRDPRRSYTG
jgi:NAD(P)-dependent dehydrogenase (short-subunit alcohol dehydrogenase family)